MYLMLETLACFRGFDARLVEGLASCLPSVCHGKEYNLDQFYKAYWLNNSIQVVLKSLVKAADHPKSDCGGSKD